MNEVLTKGFWVTVLAGIVAYSIVKTWQQSGTISGAQNPTNSSGKNAGAFGPQLGFATMAGETQVVPMYVGIAAPSGHGDATLNAGIGKGILPGNDQSSVNSDYEPAFNTNCNDVAYAYYGAAGGMQ